MRYMAFIFVILLVIGSVAISGCIQGQYGQNNSSNNTNVNNTGNNSGNPPQTIGGRQSENNNNSSSGPTSYHIFKLI